ncbi:protein atonal homolog 8 [Thamnophis elegans]|uniref:protein atonal homolog 8 n=1 Tax=Thamnophis elegans TaxID=35005 RepID=UPI001377902A|nr:protein atonal homolog 8 [Thamnophis elegans]
MLQQQRRRRQPKQPGLQLTASPARPPARAACAKPGSQPQQLFGQGAAKAAAAAAAAESGAKAPARPSAAQPGMKNLQLTEAETRWKRFCLQELRGIQKLKRRSRPGWRGGRGRPGVPEHVRPPSPPPPGFPQGGPGAGGLPGVEAPFPAALRCPGSSLFPEEEEEEEEEEAGSAGVPESPLPALLPSRGLYNGGGGEGSASPRKRTSDPAGGGAGSEMKALQQTRRLLANARERTRVHTISAAFEALRKQVPCYSYGQKLSKLAILRIACNYILSLARLADLDYSADHSNLSFSECVEQCTRTLQAEGRSKKRKE